VAVTVDDLADWLNISLATGDPRTPLLQRTLDATTQRVESRCDLPAVWPEDINLAITMQSARIWKRRNTPEGVTLGEFGGIRTVLFDRDVEDLLTPWLKFEIA
jgi:hypothetical protein